VARLRYYLNDGVEKVDVQQSWTIEFYDGPVQVVNGYVETDDELVIMGLLRRGFERVADAPAESQDTEPEQTRASRGSRGKASN